MAWIFLPGGLLMPSEFPHDKVNPDFVPEGSPFDLQIRARVTSHLENFIRDYMDPMGLEHSEIEQTPLMDYNARFYCSRTAFAEAIGQAMRDIDYTKFKPTAEDVDEDGLPLYKDGKAYHSVLNSIWGTLTRLGAPYSGLRSVASDNRSWLGSSFLGKHRAAGTSRWSDEYDYTYDRNKGWDDSTAYAEMPDDSLWDDLDGYVPRSAERKESLLELVRDIPASEWDYWLSDTELALVSAEFKAAQKAERKTRKASGGKHKKSSRRSRFSRV